MLCFIPLTPSVSFLPGNIFLPEDGVIFSNVSDFLIDIWILGIVVVITGRIFFNHSDLFPVNFIRRFPLPVPVCIIQIFRVDTGIFVPEVSHHFVIRVLFVVDDLVSNDRRRRPLNGRRPLFIFAAVDDGVIVVVLVVAAAAAVSCAALVQAVVVVVVVLRHIGHWFSRSAR